MTKNLQDYISASPTFSLTRLAELPPWEKIRLSKNLLTLADIHELRKIDGIALTMHVSALTGCNLDALHKMPPSEKLDWARALLLNAFDELNEND